MYQEVDRPAKKKNIIIYSHSEILSLIDSFWLVVFDFNWASFSWSNDFTHLSSINGCFMQHKPSSHYLITHCIHSCSPASGPEFKRKQSSRKCTEEVKYFSVFYYSAVGKSNGLHSVVLSISLIAERGISSSSSPFNGCKFWVFTQMVRLSLE